MAVDQHWFPLMLCPVLPMQEAVKFSNNTIMNYKSGIVFLKLPLYLIISGRNPSGNNAYFVTKLQPETLDHEQEGNFGMDPSVQAVVCKMRN